MRRVILWAAMVAVIAVTGSCIFGCAYDKDIGTFAEFDPVSHRFTFATKTDNQATLEEGGATWTESGGSITIKNLDVNTNASDVRNANVNQMMAFVEQQRAANEGIQIALQGLSSIVMSVSTITGQLQHLLQGSNVNLDTQWGSGSATLGTALGDMSEELAGIQELLSTQGVAIGSISQRLDALEGAATQPAVEPDPVLDGTPDENN